MQGDFSSTSEATGPSERKPKSISSGSFDNTTLFQASSTDQYVGSLSTEAKKTKTKRKPRVPGGARSKQQGYASQRMKEYRARLQEERQANIKTIGALQRENQSLKQEISALRKSITEQSVGKIYDPIRDKHC